MKETVAVILIWVGATVMNIAFWVWLISLLVWKFFAVVGASTVIYPSFFFLIGGIIVFVVGIILGSIFTRNIGKL
jgi:hypothetical protein|nr:MAG TPA: hypothetical protein [Caudoviricetes sp.]